MSLQMPPEGGGYSRTTQSGIFLPRNLIARDARGEVVPLPERVGRRVLDTTPESLARDYVILPLRVRPDDGAIEFLCGGGPERDADADLKIRFILNRTTEYCFAERSAVERLIDYAYLDGPIVNCERRFPSACPGTFQELQTTEDPRCRLCLECGKAVRLDVSKDARRRRASAGLTTAEPRRDEVTEVLQEFVSYSAGSISQGDADWLFRIRSRRERYEILEPPEPFRGDGEASAETEGEPPAAE